MALTEPRDRAVIGPLVSRDHPIGDVLHTLPLDPARGALSQTIGVKQQGDHHRRLVRRPATTIRSVSTIKRRQIHLLSHRQHKPREVVFRQPLPQTRRQQQLLIPVTSYEVLGHTSIVINPSDTTSLCNNHRQEQAPVLTLTTTCSLWTVGSRKRVCTTPTTTSKHGNCGPAHARSCRPTQTRSHCRSNPVVVPFSRVCTTGRLSRFHTGPTLLISALRAPDASRYCQPIAACSL